MKHRFRTALPFERRVGCLLLVACVLGQPATLATDNAIDAQNQQQSAAVAKKSVSQPRAVGLLRLMLQQIAHGPAFMSRVRETVWATGREVVGVGTYEQAGQGSGQYNLQITMHDGDGQHQIQQISDGRLAWTRSEIAGKVSLRRVDVGRLDEWVRPTGSTEDVSPRLKIGGWTELLDTVQRDYIIDVRGASLNGHPVWVISGNLRPDVRERTLAESGRKTWPVLFPTSVRILVNGKSDPETGFGYLLPVRFEFYSDPVESDSSEENAPQGRLITSIELYSIQPLTPPPPVERFRFDNQEAEVNFVNETERYIERFGVQLTSSQRKSLRR